MAGTLRILMVEDDALRGHRRHAQDKRGVESARIREEFDLVMVDGNLEDGYGADLVSTIRHAHAGVPFLGMSGDPGCVKGPRAGRLSGDAGQAVRPDGVDRNHCTVSQRQGGV